MNSLVELIGKRPRRVDIKAGSAVLIEKGDQLLALKAQAQLLDELGSEALRPDLQRRTAGFVKVAMGVTDEKIVVEVRPEVSHVVHPRRHDRK